MIYAIIFFEWFSGLLILLNGYNNLALDVLGLTNFCLVFILNGIEGKI